MNDDLVRKLREPWFTNGCERYQLDAADHIEALTAERDRLQVALTRLLEPYGDDPCYYDHHGYCQAHFVEADCCVAYARAALKGETQ